LPISPDEKFLVNEAEAEPPETVTVSFAVHEPDQLPYRVILATFIPSDAEQLKTTGIEEVVFPLFGALRVTAGEAHVTTTCLVGLD
jgi:hypothetical protein